MAYSDTPDHDPAFAGQNDPRFDGYVMSLARKQAERDFHFGLGQLVVGCTSAILSVYWTITHFSETGYLPAVVLVFSLSVLIRGGPSTLQRAAQLQSDLPDHLSRTEKHQVRGALNTARTDRNRTTPGTAALRRNIHILLLLRLLAVVSILAMVVVAVARDQAKTRQHYADNPHLSDPNLMLYSTRYASDEFWVRYANGSNDGTWYGVGP